jgi:hypothetical protein
MPCGQEERDLRANGSSRYVAIHLYYLGSQPTDIRGPVTGYPYHFSPLHPVQSVDPRDAVDLLVNRQFRLAR